MIVQQREGETMEDMWQEALSVVQQLRQMRFTPIAPPDQFDPFGYITLCNFADVVRDHEIHREMIIGGCFDTEEALTRQDESPYGPEFHARRVDALIKAWNLIDAEIRGEPHELPTLAPWH